MNHPTILMTPIRSALLAGHDNAHEVLVRVQGPALPASMKPQRPPLHLALVIDRSGSMDGQPLAEAKRCAEHVIDGLLPEDRVSLVIYDHHVETLMPAVPLGDRATLRRAIRGIDCRGSTNLHGGWLRGAETLAPHTANDAISRVILLSDGCANQGETRTDRIAAQCRELADAGVTTSTYGLGRHFNEDLMVEMARAGGGNHYYGETAEDLMDPFREELSLLNALCAHGLALELDAPDGVRIEMLNDYPRNDQGGWRLPDLAYGSEAWALVRLHVAATRLDRMTPSDRLPLLRARVRYTDPAGEPRAVEAEELRLSVLPSVAYDAVARDALVERRLRELEVAGIQRRARNASRAGDWDEVQVLLERIHTLGADDPWILEVGRELEALAARRDEVMFMKEAMYGARHMGTRLTAIEESIDVNEPAADLFLRRKMRQGRVDVRTSKYR